MTTRSSLSPRAAGAIAVLAALVVAALWFGRRRTPTLPTALEGTVMITLARHDALGQPSKPERIRDRARVRAIVAALDVDGQPPAACPSDYATAEIGLVLGGADVYSRRNVYLWRVLEPRGEADPPVVLVVTESGCSSGPPADAARLRQEIQRGGD